MGSKWVGGGLGSRCDVICGGMGDGSVEVCEGCGTTASPALERGALGIAYVPTALLAPLPPRPPSSSHLPLLPSTPLAHLTLAPPSLLPHLPCCRDGQAGSMIASCSAATPFRWAPSYVVFVVKRGLSMACDCVAESCESCFGFVNQSPQSACVQDLSPCHMHRPCCFCDVVWPE